MKKILRFMSCLLIVCMLVSFIPVMTTDVSAATVKLSRKKVTLETGAKFRLVLKNAGGKVKWSSGNKKVVKVTSTGVVTAVGPGTAKVTAKYAGKKYSCTFNVPKPELNHNDYKFKKIGGSVRLKLIGAEADGYKSSDKSVVTVSSKGLVRAKGNGQAVITVTDVNGYEYECTVTVNAPGQEKEKEQEQENTPDTDDNQKQEDTRDTDTVHTHKTVTDYRVEPTCTEDGLTSGVHCETCGEVILAQKVLPALGHTYNEEGYCIRCSEPDPIKHHQHVYVTESDPATCTKAGKTDRVYCATCGTVFMETKAVPALGHDWNQNGYCNRCGVAWYCDHQPETIAAVPVSCTKDGCSEYVRCKLCGEILVQPTFTPLLGHDYGGTDHCLRCGADRNGHVHTWQIVPTVAPTCTEPGLTQGEMCTTCGEWKIQQDFILPKEHDYDENGVCRVCHQKKP